MCPSVGVNNGMQNGWVGRWLNCGNDHVSGSWVNGWEKFICGTMTLVQERSLPFTHRSITALNHTSIKKNTFVWQKLLVKDKTYDDRSESSKRLRDGLLRAKFDCWEECEDWRWRWIGFVRRVEITYTYYMEEGPLKFQTLVKQWQPLSNCSHYQWWRFWLPGHFVVAPLLFGRREHSQ